MKAFMTDKFQVKNGFWTYWPWSNGFLPDISSTAAPDIIKRMRCANGSSDRIMRSALSNAYDHFDCFRFTSFDNFCSSCRRNVRYIYEKYG